MSRFPNSYWSPDYISGIEKLSRQLDRSLGQLHELRKLVFGYFKYFHSNGEYLTDLADSAFPVDSSFRILRGQRNMSGVRKISGPNAREVPPEVDLTYIFHQYVLRSGTELRNQQELAAEIDSTVLTHITNFIKLHEPQIKATFENLRELFLDYTSAHEKLESVKQQYEDYLRYIEFSGDIAKRSADEKLDQEDSPALLSPVASLGREDVDSDTTVVSSAPQFDFSFPLTIGGVITFGTEEDLTDFLSTLVSSITVKRRKIPMPGYRNEIFSSEQLFECLIKGRPMGFNPTRLNLEKLGQGLLNSKLLVGTGFFALKFSSEGMWFEWPEVVISAVNAGPSRESQKLAEPFSLPSQKLSKVTLDKAWSDVANSTSKSLNGVFSSMKSSLMKPKYTEQGLRDAEIEYNKAYEDLQKLKHLLDVEIILKAQSLEGFEKLKIEVIYQSLTKLLEVMYQHSLKSTTALHDFTKRFVSEFNKQEHYIKDFNLTQDSFSSGIYFPSLVAPDYLSHKHVNTSQLNTNFQNIRLTFNLYKDVPLQVKLVDASESSVLLSTQSIPFFLWRVIELIESLLREEVHASWLEPIKYQDYWLLKSDVISVIQNYKHDAGHTPRDDIASESAIIQSVVDFLQTKEALRIVNFLKNWLLEISDSVVPSTVFDSLVGNYKIKNGKSLEQRAAETVRVLSTTPRSNLSSLIRILEHIANIFNLKALPSYSDNAATTEGDSGDVSVSDTTAELNLMELIGSVPFIHLIMRPSVVKNTTGFKPPTKEYNLLLCDLLALNIREQLLQALVSNERNYMERQEQQRKTSRVHKRPETRSSSATTRTETRSSSSAMEPSVENPAVEVTPVTPTKPVVSSVLPPRSPVQGESFALRPFRTGTTPRPSPSASPVHAKKKTVDLNVLSRSRSSTLDPSIDLKYIEQS